MIMTDFSKMRIYLKPGQTDMRKSINTLSILVQEIMKLDLFQESMFVFCNKPRNLMKVLYWDKNGFCLWIKRLEKHKFQWPRNMDDILELNIDQFSWLLSGFDYTRAHDHLSYQKVI